MNLYRNEDTGLVFGADGDVERRILKQPKKYVSVEQEIAPEPSDKIIIEDSIAENVSNEAVESKPSPERKPIKMPKKAKK